MFPDVSNSAHIVSNVFLFVCGITVVLLILVTSLMVYFVIKSNKRRNPTPVDVEGSTLLEITWTVVPTFIVLAMFYYGWIGFKEMRTVPKDAMVVKVNGYMWSWLFEYANGKQSGILNLPAGKPVKLELSSRDVIHSFFIPAFRVKEDVVPGKGNYLWFKPLKFGSYDVFCAEYCGQKHYSMLTKVVVMPEEEFKTWYGREEKKMK